MATGQATMMGGDRIAGMQESLNRVVNNAVEWKCHGSHSPQPVDTRLTVRTTGAAGFWTTGSLHSRAPRLLPVKDIETVDI